MVSLEKPLLRPQVREALRSSLAMPEAVDKLLIPSDYHYHVWRRRQRSLVDAGHRMTKSLHVIEAARESLQKYFDFAGMTFDIEMDTKRATFEPFRKTLEALGTEEEEIKASFLAVENRDLRRSLSIQRLFADIPVTVKAIDDLVSHAIKGPPFSSNPIDMNKVYAGLCSASLGWPSVIMSLVFNTELGSAGIIPGGSMITGGVQSILAGVTSE